MTNYAAKDTRTRYQKWIDWWFPHPHIDAPDVERDSEGIIHIKMTTHFSWWDRVRIVYGGGMCHVAKIATKEEVVTVVGTNATAFPTAKSQFSRDPPGVTSEGCP